MRKKVSLSYKPVLHINNIRQVAKFKSFEEVKSGQNEEKKKRNSEKDKEEGFLIISSKSRTKVVFEFLFHPEYVDVNSNILINDNLLKAYGIITKLY